MKAMEGAGIELAVDGQTISIQIEDMTGSETKLFREAVGMSPAHALASGDIDLDVLAGFVWIVRRRSAPGLTFDGVASTLSWKSVEFDTAAEADDDPEA